LLKHYESNNTLLNMLIL